MSTAHTYPDEPIIALATPSGIGAIAVLRISGKNCLQLVVPFFKGKRPKDLLKQSSHTVHLGNIVDGDRILDEVLLTLFKGPHSYTGEDVVEISCHGSIYIQQEIMQLFLKNGVRHATPGEFTLRAFLNGKMDLSQAEAVADLIASDSASSHQIAMQQMRGGFSSEISALRDQLLNFASLIELELDFSEEDVEFADRTEFRVLVDKISAVLKRLIDSFALGNVLKNGVPVAIVGAPNAGKSTLLNAILNEERAIVSNIPGTTRDVIEDEIVLGGVAFRFIDTAGIRETKDVIESAGIRKTFEKMGQAQLILYLIDICTLDTEAEIKKHIEDVLRLNQQNPDKKIVVLLNKADQVESHRKDEIKKEFENNQSNQVLLMAAKDKTGLDQLIDLLKNLLQTGQLSNNQTIVSNSRHFEALNHALSALIEVDLGLDQNLSADLMAIDIRKALYHLGEITGQISSDDLLGNIFANFCIGK